MYFQVLVDVQGNASYSNPRYPGGDPKGYRLLPELPIVDVVAGSPARLGVVAPATVAAGEGFSVLVRVEDAYGNVCTDFKGRSRSRCEAGRHQRTCTFRHRGE